MSESPTRLLRRLLGPAGPELTCEECFEQIDRYVESELDAAVDADRAVPGMAAHLAGCPACAAEHLSLRALLQADRAGGSPAGEPDQTSE